MDIFNRARAEHADEIQDWLADSDLSKRFEMDFSSAEAFGRVLHSNDLNTVTDATNVRFVLQKNGAGGWNILTVKLSDTPIY